MLKDIKQMIDYIKEISSLIYGKEVFFYDYDTDTWYSREHCENIEIEDIISWLRENVNSYFIDEDEYDCKYVVKYKNKNSDESWDYKEFDDDISCYRFTTELKASKDIEFTIFKEDMDFN